MGLPDRSVSQFRFARALLPGGWAADVRVSISNGRFAEVSAGDPACAGEDRRAVVLPGLPNLHSHAFQRGMAGLAERRGPASDSFWTWRDTLYRFVDRIGPAELQAIAALAYAEMLESGFTRVGEFHYLHHAPGGAAYADPAEMAAAVAAAAECTGIALTLLPVFYAHSDFGGAAPTPGQRRFVTDPDSFARLLAASGDAIAPLAGAVLGIAPHSLRAVTPDELSAILPLAGAGPVHIHVAEQLREVEDCIAWSGARAADWLLDHAPVDDRWCLVHATHVSANEIERLAKSGAVAGLCPITEANLGDGIFPAAAFVAAGGRFGIGSDSNVLIDAAEELRLLEYGQRLSLRARNVMARGVGRSTGADLFTGALAGGAQALGAAGGIAVGLPADFLSLDAGHPALVGRTDDALLDALVFAGGRGAIDCVWRAGEKRVEGGRHVARAAIEARYRAVMADILA